VAIAPSPPGYPAAPKVAVGAVVIKDAAVLLVKRSQKPNAGLWAIPGGSVELGESLRQAAEREIFEETGIRIAAGDPVLTFEAIERDRHGRVQYHYVITDLDATYLEGEPVAGDDAADARWVGLNELATLPVSHTTLDLLQQRFGFNLTADQVTD